MSPATRRAATRRATGRRPPAPDGFAAAAAGTARTVVAAGLVATLAAACASTPNGTAQDLAGCYYFEQDDTAAELNLPWGVRLTTDSLTGWPAFQDEPDVHRAITLVGPEQTADIPFSYWQIRGDSLRIGYPGMGGFVLELAPANRALLGTARGVGDAGLGERPRHEVRLDRARCPE